MKDSKVKIDELKSKVVMALIDRGVFSKDENAKVTKFQNGIFHLRSDNDSGKAKIEGNTIKFDTVEFGEGTVELIENRNSEKPEVKELIEKFGLDDTEMDKNILVYDRKSDKLVKFEMKKTISSMNNGIKAMQVQRVKFHISGDDLILNTNLDRYIK